MIAESSLTGHAGQDSRPMLGPMGPRAGRSQSRVTGVNQAALGGCTQLRQLAPSEYRHRGAAPE